MIYRAEALTQRDGSELASSNCRMTAIAVGLDYESAGMQTSSGREMRARQSDQSGGTDSGDAAEAWASYSQDLRIRDGSTFDDARADLVAGRLVHLDIWAAAMAPAGCPSGTAQYGHTIAVAPEQSGTRWLVSDPWCSPPKWSWIEEALLRQAAEEWGGMCYSGATSGRGSIAGAVLLALMRLAAKRLMSAHRPDAPAATPPPADTAGAAGRIMFTTTHGPEPAIEEIDMPIVSATGLATGIRARVPKGIDWFEDPNLTRRGGSMSSDADVVYVGAPVGETVAGGSYAIQVNTGSIYGDGVIRPTIVYVAASDADTYSVPPPVPPDVEEIRLEVHEEWEDALRHGLPWPSTK